MASLAPIIVRIVRETWFHRPTIQNLRDSTTMNLQYYYYSGSISNEPNCSRRHCLCPICTLLRVGSLKLQNGQQVYWESGFGVGPRHALPPVCQSSAPCPHHCKGRRLSNTPVGTILSGSVCVAHCHLQFEVVGQL